MNGKLLAMVRLAHKTLRGGLGLVLSFWIAGAGCMFGCSEMALASTDLRAAESAVESLATVVSGEACASSGSHDCCARKRSAEQARTQKSKNRVSLQLATLLSASESLGSIPSRRVRECPLALSRAIAVTKGNNQKFGQTIAALPASALTSQMSMEFQAAVEPAARLPNRGHTYLRCCIFLI